MGASTTRLAGGSGVCRPKVANAKVIVVMNSLASHFSESPRIQEIRPIMLLRSSEADKRMYKSLAAMAII